MTDQSTTQQLFAALKPEDGTSANAINDASHSAEARWPLLKSLAPEKWGIAPTLSEEEKLNRKQLETLPVVTRRPAASEPNINTQLANALNRMLEPKMQVSISPESATLATSASVSQAASADQEFKENASAEPMPSPLPPLRQPNITPTQQIEAVYSAAPPIASPPSTIVQKDADSVESILNRIERAHAPASVVTSKVPGFLARLGKR
jgi:hypothetical protein